MRACRPSLLLEAYTRRVDAMVCLARFGSHGAHWVHGAPCLLSPQPCRCMFCCMLHVSYGTHAMQSFALGYTVGLGYSLDEKVSRADDGLGFVSVSPGRRAPVAYRAPSETQRVACCTTVSGRAIMLELRTQCPGGSCCSCRCRDRKRFRASLIECSSSS